MAKLSRLYAAALFDLLLEDNAVDESLEQIVFLRDALNNAEYQRVLTHPHIPSAEKRKLVESAFSGHVRDDLFGFLCLAIDKNRKAYVVPALSELIGMIERRKRMVTANVLSAVELDKKQITALEKMLSKKLDKQVTVSLKVDPSAIGGLYIHVDGFFVDNTLKKRLHDMTASMKVGCRV
jgi:F-type H+-transporting ATPase subunit delta